MEIVTVRLRVADASGTGCGWIYANERSYCIMPYAKLENAILRFADLRGADLQHADLRLTKLENADLRDADLSGGGSCEGAYL